MLDDSLWARAKLVMQYLYLSLHYMQWVINTEFCDYFILFKNMFKNKMFFI